MMSTDLPVTREIGFRASRQKLDRHDYKRYARQIILDQIGPEGQKRLKAARVLVVGAGGLGSPCLLYLAGAGIGSIGIAEFDQVDVSNLQRQILFAEHQAGQSKAEAAQKRLREINPAVDIKIYHQRVTSKNIQSIFESYDVVVDGSDNFVTRYLVSDMAVDLKKPYIYGSVQGFSGQVAVFYPPFGPCYRCLFPNPPPPALIPNCSESGVLGSLAGTIGTMQATEAIKLVLGIGKPLIGRILIGDALSGEFSSVHLGRDPDCLGCGTENRSMRPYPQPNLCESSESHRDRESAGTAALTQRTSGATRGVAYEVTPNDLMKLSQSVVMIDVRTLDEQLKQGMIHHELGPTLGVPLGDLEEALLTYRKEGVSRKGGENALAKTALLEISKATRERPIVLYCKTGPRSRRAWEILSQIIPESSGEEFWVLKGGYLGWLENQSKGPSENNEVHGLAR